MSALHQLLASAVRHHFSTLRPKSFRVRLQGGTGTTDSSREANFVLLSHIAEVLLAKATFRLNATQTYISTVPPARSSPTTTQMRRMD